MKKDNFKTEVIFRVDKEGVFALLPYDIARNDGAVTSYQHIGQHGAAWYGYCIDSSRPAKPEEYDPLFKEMESLGYNLKIVKRQNRKRYINCLMSL